MGKILKDNTITISNISLNPLSLYPIYTPVVNNICGGNVKECI